ncbi:hypothetical protein [Paraliomyxa miuraensis]|uniref:hypothetical protein n=1 Tax=Paraliomyxa miuraensis TaxID=376150 RepID=UPI00224E6604|nr:hypothetical protein [Paraliomyxa miuraensis]MCX4244340.1 hypothetical protein [Paraliomyxa miuraensis]
MRQGWIVFGFTLGALGSVTASCGAAFACASDDECQSGAATGVCQGNGYCSFPDEDCPSGQRFGDAAPAGVANACVEHGGTEGSTTVGESGPSSSSATDASATVMVDEGSTAPTESAESADSSGGSTDGCSQVIVDEFDGTALDRRWVETTTAGGSVTVDGGQLLLTLPNGMNQAATYVTTELGVVAGGWARVRLDEIGEPKANAGLALGNGTCELQIFTTAETVGAFVWNVPMQAGTSIASEDLTTLPVTLQLRVLTDGEVRFEFSQDEVTWTPIAEGSDDACGDFGGPLSSVIFLNAGVPQGASQQYQRFEACLP